VGARVIDFAKGHGTLNDFVLFTDADDLVRLTDAQVQALCHRRAGLGADGVLRAVRARHVPEWTGEADLWFMDYRNADGSIAQMCGNGLRVFARYLVESGLADGPRVRVGTRAGLRVATLLDDGTVAASMGPARVGGHVTVRPGGSALDYAGRSVDVGNPHAVCFVPPASDDQDLDEQAAGCGRADPGEPSQGGESVGSLDALDLTRPPVWEPASAFPDGVNVEFVEVVGPARLRMRVHERGVGETCSCGTGVVAAAAAYRARTPDAPSEIGVDVPGGSLIVRFDRDEAQLVGPAVIVAHGRVDVDACAAGVVTI